MDEQDALNSRLQATREAAQEAFTLSLAVVLMFVIAGLYVFA